jgi:hypothetical protein
MGVSNRQKNNTHSTSSRAIASRSFLRVVKS